MLRIGRIALALSCLPLAAASAYPQALEQLRRMAPSAGLLEVPAVSGSPAVLASRASVENLGTAEVSRQPQASVNLAEIRDQYWKTTDGFGRDGERIYLSAHFDLEGNAYVSVLPAAWASPYFYKLERGMDGYWEYHGARYHILLDVSIWRARTNNIIEIYREGGNEPVFTSRIVELLAKGFATGKTVRIGRKDYRLFYSCSVDGSKSPAEADPRRLAVFLAEDVGEPGKHDFNNYIFPVADISKTSISRYALSNGQTVGLKLSADGETLQLYELAD
ncbi:MAG: hypothetical protein NTY77_19925 [Elusimicrobia bacterium]|nr:hypothetical protein [Elusimicrobiota bacterium]